MASSLPGLRRAASKLSKDFFICHQYSSTARRTPVSSKLPIKSNISRTIRFNSSAAAFPEPIVPKPHSTPLESLSQNLRQNIRPAKNAGAHAEKKFFPSVTSKSVAYWLLGSAASVFGIVVFGGLTRLTESGYAPNSVAKKLRC